MTDPYAALRQCVEAMTAPRDGDYGRRFNDALTAASAALERQQLSYEREREIDQDEIERLIALRRDDARVLDAERAGRAAAVLAMRERCAGACEDEARLWEADGKGPATEARLCAARIRSLA